MHAVIIGHNCDEAAKALSELPLIKKVIQVEAAHYENFVAENFAPVIVKLAENYSHIICSCLLYTSPSPRDMRRSRMPSSA